MISELGVLLSDEDRKIVEDSIKNNGYYTIETIKDQILKVNNIYSDYTHIDVDLIITIDLYINYPIFLTESGIYTKDTMMNTYYMKDFDTTPEVIFNRLYVIVVNDEYFLYDPEEEKKEVDKIYPTQIYIGKERWKDYMAIYRLRNALKFLPKSSLKLIDNNEKENQK